MAKNDDIAAALSRMVQGDTSASAEPSHPASSIPASPLPAKAPAPLPSGANRPMATPQPRPKASPVGADPVPTSTATEPDHAAPPSRRTLPNSPAAMHVTARPLSGSERARQVMASSSLRATLTPPLLTLGLLLVATGVVSQLAGEALVIGSLPGWIVGTAVGAGLLLLVVGAINVRQLARDAATAGG